MRKFLKFIATMLLGIVAVLAIAAAAVYWKSGDILARTYHVGSVSVHVPSGDAALARGKHLAETRGCIDCHGRDLAGEKVIDDPAMGRLYGSNITRGRGGLPADYSDEDFARAIRHGVGRGDRALFLMPSVDYARFSDNDLGDLIAYLKSVPPVDRPTVAIAPGPVARALVVAGKITLAAAEIDHANLRPDNVVPGITVEYGRYVAASCIGCHGNNFSGGKIDIGPPDWPPAANLTSHPTSSISGWTEADFVAAIRTAKRPDGSSINPVMPRAFGGMNDIELSALWMFLRTTSPLPTGTR